MILIKMANFHEKIDDIKTINGIVAIIEATLKHYPSYFCDEHSVIALFCDMLIDHESFMEKIGLPLFDVAQPFGEFYYLCILKRIDELANYDDIGITIYEEVIRGRDETARRFLAKLLESTLKIKGKACVIVCWKKCPICGCDIFAYENACSKCKTSYDEYDNIEADLKDAETKIDSVTYSTRKTLDEIKKRLDPYFKKIAKNAAFSKLSERVKSRLANKTVEFHKIEESENKKAIEAKEIDFQKDSEALINSIKGVSESKKVSSSMVSYYEQRINDIDKKYKKLPSYRSFKAVADEGLARLELRVRENDERKATRKFITILTSGIAAGVIFLFWLCWFLCELAGVAPPLLFAKVATGFKGEQVNGSVCVISAPNSVKNLTVPESTRLPWSFKELEVTKIGDSAFYLNSSLETVTLPKSINKIGKNAFYSCSNLKSITLLSDAPPFVETTAFDDFQGVIYVPEESYNLYLNGYGWQYYKQTVFPDYGLDSRHAIIMFDSNGGTHVDDIKNAPIGEVVALPSPPQREGYHFMGWYLNDKIFASEEAVFTKSVKLVAKWSQIEELILNSNCGATPEKISVEVADGEKIVLPLNTFVNKGYHFAGWSTQSDGNVEYADGAKFTMNIKKGYNLYAVWSPNENYINFNSGSGTGEMERFKIKTGETVPLPPNEFVKKGYDFCGWSVSAEDLEVVYMDEGVYIMGNEPEYTLYAVWRIHVYSLVYNLNGGINHENNLTEFKIDSAAFDLLPPSREGYTFDAWYEDKNFSDKLDTIEPSLLLRDCELFARWIPKSNKLHFNSNGGLGIMEDASVLSDEKIPLPACTFTKSGYQFAGWSETSNGSFAYSNNDEYSMGVKPEYILYAIWQKVLYTITYNLNGGTNSLNNPVNYHIESEKITLLNATREGFAFDGWYTDITLTTSRILYIEQGSTVDIELYAKWKENTNTLIFNANGGSGQLENKKLNTYSSCTLPKCTFYKNGYQFAGWSLSAGGSSAYSDGSFFEMGTSSSVTLYAIWSLFSYTIMYNLDGGINNRQNPVGYEINSETITLQNPTRSGYVFKGWYTDAAKTVIITKIPTGSTGNIVLYADWAAAQYKVSFDYNNGTSDINSRYVYYDSSYGTLPITSRAGFDFVGWFYGNTRIYDGSIVKIASNHTLTAKWIGRTYTVYFNYGSGVQGIIGKSVVYNSTYGTLPTTSLTGHTFNGWYYNNVKITESTKVGVSGSHTLTAKFTPIYYTVTVNAPNITVTITRLDTNAKVASGSTVPYGVKLSITYKVNDGYENGWCNPSGTVTVTGNLTINGGADKIPSCFAAGTRIMLKGKETVVENLRIGDIVLAFDHLTGRYVESEIAFTYKAYGTVNQIKLFFSDGSKITLLNSGHGLFNLTLNKYVLINADTASEFMAHSFYYTEFVNGEYIGKSVQLISYVISKETVYYYDFVTSRTLNLIANGLLTCSDTLVGVSNVFSFDNDLQVNHALMSADIEKYGLFTYDEWSNYLTEEEFIKFNGAVFKVALGKGLLTIDELYSLLEDLARLWNGTQV